MQLVLFLYALFASVFTIAKTGLRYTEPLFFVGTRMLIAGGMMLAYQFIAHRNDFSFKKKDMWKILQLAVFNIYLCNFLEFWGLQYLTSFKTCFIYSLSPFVSALFSYLIFSEKMTPKKWLGFTVGFLGFIPILLQKSSSEKQVEHLFFLSWAELAVIGAAVSSVYGWILLRQLVKEEGYSPLMANGMSMSMGGVMALLHSYFRENWDPFPVTETIPFLGCAVLLMIISNLLAYNLYGYLLRRFTATFLSFAGFTTPLFAALFGWFYLGEVVTPPFYLSTVIVFCGLLIFHQEELKQGYSVQPEPIEITEP
ncbi:MAG: DMT family transporter [Waddliaceae bacterium]